MPTEYKLSHEELRTILRARVLSSPLDEEKVRVRLAAEFGVQMPEKDPKSTAIRDALYDLMADLVARRLEEGRRDEPFVSPDDAAAFAPQLFVKLMEDKEIPIEMHEFIKAALQKACAKAFEVMEIIALPGSLYDAHQQWVEVVLELAAEGKITPIELLARDKGWVSDEFLRRTSTKEQYLIDARAMFDRIFNADKLKEIVGILLVDVVAEDPAFEANAEELSDLRRELDEPASELEDFFTKAKPVLTQVLSEEADRIYGA